MNKYSDQRTDGNGGRETKKGERFIRHNWKIKNPMCRLVEDGKPPRVMPTKDALRLAQDAGTDLVEVGYDKYAGVSIVKITDYGKYVYLAKQKEKQLRKAARENQVEIKEVQLSLTIDTADLDRMVDRAKNFLAEGDKVKLALRFRGKREMANLGLAKDLMKRVLSNFDGVALLDSVPQLAGREMSCVLRPAKRS